MSGLFEILPALQALMNGLQVCAIAGIHDLIEISVIAGLPLYKPGNGVICHINVPKYRPGAIFCLHGE
jgi:hypothetical protein